MGIRPKYCSICGSNLHEPFRSKTGKILWDECMTKEHILPREFVRTVNSYTNALGFKYRFTADDERNITYTCRKCNRHKSDKLLFPYAKGARKWILSTAEDKNAILEYAQYLIDNSARITWYYTYAIVYDYYGRPKHKEGKEEWFRFLADWCSGVKEFQ